MPVADKKKLRAHWKVKHAIASGDLIRKPCEKCGTNKSVQAHHDNYNEPLNVTWLCPTCHKRHKHPVTRSQIEKRKRTMRERGGFHHSEEAKKRIGMASRKRKRTRETRRKTSESVSKSWEKRWQKLDAQPIGCTQCKVKPYAKGLCSVCYQRQWRRDKRASS